MSPKSSDSTPDHSARRIKALDGIRGLAILGVIAYHTLRVSGSAHGLLLVWRAIQESSWAGVDLFFVLSGFLITGILLDSKGNDGYFKNFYARRTLRIMPLYYAVLALTFFVVPAVVGLARLPSLFTQLLANQIWLWTYLQNYLQSTGAHTLPGFGHFWTLAVEEQFYWFWPILVYWVSRRHLFQLCVAICILEPMLRFALLHWGVSAWAIRHYTFTRIDTLLYGALASLLMRDSRLVARRSVVPLLLTGALAVLGISLFRKGFIAYEGIDTVVLGYSALGVVFSTAVYSVASGREFLGGLLSLPVLRWFGKYSYAIYIFNWPITQAYQAIVGHRAANLPRPISALCCFFVVTALSAGVAVLSWWLLESRFLQLKRYFETGRHAAFPAVGAVSRAQSA